MIEKKGLYRRKGDRGKTYIGIDLGLSGAISLINEDKELLFCKPIPTLQVQVGKKLRNQYDIQAIICLFKNFLITYQIIRAGMERLRGIPNQQSQTAFSMGGSTMLFKTIFTFTSIPYIEFEPVVWQKKIFGDLGVQYTRKTTKIASVVAAKQLFPAESFKKTARCMKADDGMTDSCLIGYYLSSL